MGSTVRTKVQVIIGIWKEGVGLGDIGTSTIIKAIVHVPVSSCGSGWCFGCIFVLFFFGCATLCCTEIFQGSLLDLQGWPVVAAVNRSGWLKETSGREGVGSLVLLGFLHYKQQQQKEIMRMSFDKYQRKEYSTEKTKTY